MIDFSPAPAAAPRHRQIVAHAMTEVSLMVRNGEQLLLALVIPIAMLVGVRVFGQQIGVGINDITPSVLALAAWSTGFTSLAITTAFERRYGVLERLNATSLGASGLLYGKALQTVIVTSGQLAILMGIAAGLGWRPGSLNVTAIAVTPLAMATFAALALMLAGRLRAEAVLGLANLIYLIGAATGIMIPLRAFAQPAQLALTFLPTMAYGEIMRGSSSVVAVLVIVGWLCCAGFAARKVFQWTS